MFENYDFLSWRSFLWRNVLPFSSAEFICGQEPFHQQNIIFLILKHCKINCFLIIGGRVKKNSAAIFRPPSTKLSPLADINLTDWRGLILPADYSASATSQSAIG
jgi:hypothetical protein